MVKIPLMRRMRKKLPTVEENHAQIPEKEDSTLADEQGSSGDEESASDEGADTGGDEGGDGMFG